MKNLIDDSIRHMVQMTSKIFLDYITPLQKITYRVSFYDYFNGTLKKAVIIQQ